jgi:hypothetical protein
VFSLYLFMKTLLVLFGIKVTCHYDKTLRSPRYIVGRERMYIIAETSSVQKRSGFKQTTGHFRKNEDSVRKVGESVISCR